MTREELAARIYANGYEKPSVRNRGSIDWYVTPRQALKAADHFFKSIEKHREPKAECEHKFVYPGSKCGTCGEIKPEPPKPERKAREWKLYDFQGSIRAFPMDQMVIHFVGDAPSYVCSVREVFE